MDLRESTRNRACRPILNRIHRRSRNDSAQAISACYGDMRATIRALILANEFLEAELKANTSKGYKRGYAHGRFKIHAD